MDPYGQPTKPVVPCSEVVAPPDQSALHLLQQEFLDVTAALHLCLQQSIDYWSTTHQLQGSTFVRYVCRLVSPEMRERLRPQYTSQKNFRDPAQLATMIAATENDIGTVRQQRLEMATRTSALLSRLSTVHKQLATRRCLRP